MACPQRHGRSPNLAPGPARRVRRERSERLRLIGTAHRHSRLESSIGFRAGRNSPWGCDESIVVAGAEGSPN